ncbi:hypothetical protein KUV41_02255 [Halomonas sp. DP8Y7-1]|uniref:hypothetical protein n=1 Tax=Halomonas sp. DP8Y7-1 TaxID=2859078 RepID=UPI001C93B12A|nr:hypothetical protein [Halomonas sp. DP8Y7-1]MBY6028171.1 hypothetical protein [Halomonas sp. DP8Y7-1]
MSDEAEKMNLLMPCMECFRELGYPTSEFALLEFRDDGRYEICCSRGHRSVTVLQQQKFEILFDIGANAILDGYYREAVSSFTSSLERFYEFCIKVLCRKRGIKSDVFSMAWKKVSNQSERQLGAFLFLWASEFGEVPDLLSSKNAGFRNNVIHKGKIPTKEESLEYGNTVLAIIRPKISQLKSVCDDQIREVTFEHIRDCSSHGEGEVPGGTMCANTIVSLTTAEERHNSQTLEEALARLLERRDIVTSTESITKV